VDVADLGIRADAAVEERLVVVTVTVDERHERLQHRPERILLVRIGIRRAEQPA